MLIKYSTLIGRCYNYHGFATLEGDVQPSLPGNSCGRSASTRLGKNHDLGKSLLVSKSALLRSLSLVGLKLYRSIEQDTNAFSA